MRRRPLMTPVWVSAIGALLFVGVVTWGWGLAGITTVYVVRHAEKAADGTKDPSLSPEGQAHAARYAQLFAGSTPDFRVDAVYATQFKRTQETAEAVAKPLGLKVEVINADDTSGLVEHILDHHRGKRVLVVGHSNTVPEVVAALGGAKVQELGEADYGRLYVVSSATFSRSTVTGLALP